MNTAEAAVEALRERWINPSKAGYIRACLSAFIGAMVVVALQWHFSHAWASYYSHFPWPGYEQAMKSGHVPAFLTTSPRSLKVGSGVLFTLPFLTLCFKDARLPRYALALCIGATAALGGIWLATPQLRNDSNLWPIDMLLLFLATGIPMTLGALTVLMLRTLLRFGKERQF